MKCHEVESVLTENLNQAYQPEVRQHLSQCPDCKRLLQELESIEDLNFSLSRMAGAPIGFRQRVTTQLQKRRWWQTSWTVAGTLAILVIGWTGLLMLQSFLAGDTQWASVSERRPSPGQFSGAPASVILADPAALTDGEEQYLEVILGVPLRGSSSTRGVPSEIKVYRTDMGKVNLTYVSH